jgi:UDP-N-acetyl-D-glucosamine dehydrogenase
VKLNDRILKRKAKVAIVGMGYVGLPLGIEIARSGFPVVGIDLDPKKTAALKAGKSYIEDVPSSDVKQLVDKGLLTASTSYAACRDCDIINVCVPTPFTKAKDPDNSFIHSAGREIAKYLKPDALVVLRSTTYPETTEKEFLPLLEVTGRKVGRDFYLAFVPERIDPGNTKFTTRTTPVVVGGVTRDCTRMAELFYAQFVEKVFPVSSPRVAEMEKLLENIFRSVNIALVNELAMLCERMGNVNVWEVIEAASTKPFGFMPFYPGPGIGGHCILIDPYYLAWKAREYDFHSNFIELAAQTNESMPFRVAERLIDVLGHNSIAVAQARILVLGAAFKKNVADTRESPAVKVMQLLLDDVKSMSYNDPWVPALKLNGRVFRSVPVSPSTLKKYDCVVILTDHAKYDYEMIARHARLILDARNAVKQPGLKKLYTLGYRPRKGISK